MLAIALLFFVGLYLLISVVVVVGAVKLAKSYGVAGWRFGLPAGLIMYAIVFWDHVPTLVMHKYLCTQKAGFWVSKTYEEWIAENPGAIDDLSRSMEPRARPTWPPVKSEGPQKFWLTQRFYNEVSRDQVSHAIASDEQRFFDAESGEVIAHSLDFVKGKSSNIISLGGTPDQIRQALLFGNGSRTCRVEGDQSPTDAFKRYIYKFWKHGERK